MTPSTAARSRRVGATGIVIAALVTICIGPADGQEQMTRQADLKATFLYNFAKFVAWPDDPGPDAAVTAFRIEIIGRDPFDGRFDQLMIGKKMNEQPIEVIHSLADPSPTPVRVAFVSASEHKRLDSLLSFYRRNLVLTVSDIPDFTERGGMIGFVIEPGAVGFRINLASAERSRLRVSSRLLVLAR